MNSQKQFQKNYIEQNFNIVSKEGNEIPFMLNPVQNKFLDEMSGRDIICKARQEGFSSLILALFTIDFLTKRNSRSVCISHETTATQMLFDRVKRYINALARKNRLTEFPLKYNTRNEMHFQAMDSTFYIGTAGAKAFGRGDTLTNIHLSEFAFYQDPEPIYYGVSQALIPTGRLIIESTANAIGNLYQKMYKEAKAGRSKFKAHFYSYKAFPEYCKKGWLEEKMAEFPDPLLFQQEYPANDVEAFISSGRPFFDVESLRWYLDNHKSPRLEGQLIGHRPVEFQSRLKQAR